MTLTFGLLEEPSKSGTGRKHIGVASSYLANLAPGDKLYVSVRASHASFHLPQDPSAAPVILVGSGTGIAPFRGFIQERAALLRAGRKLAPAVLYYGCREAGKDDLHADELKRWEAEGVVAVKNAYSRAKDGGPKYVQDAMWADKERVMELWEQGAKLFVCGSRKVSNGVTEVALNMGREAAMKEEGRCDVDQEKLEKWWDELRNVRYATDVFD